MQGERASERASENAYETQECTREGVYQGENRDMIRHHKESKEGDSPAVRNERSMDHSMEEGR